MSARLALAGGLKMHAQDLQFQYSHGQAYVLFRVRYQVVLCPAFSSGWHQRERTVHRF